MNHYVPVDIVLGDMEYLEELVKEKKIVARKVSRWDVYRIKRK